jgi:hypothetical protein
MSLLVSTTTEILTAVLEMKIYALELDQWRAPFSAQLDTSAVWLKKKIPTPLPTGPLTLASEGKLFICYFTKPYQLLRLIWKWERYITGSFRIYCPCSSF